MVEADRDTWGEGLVGAPPRRRGLAIWALVWSGLLAFVFVGVTAVTLALWFTDRDYLETSPVVDLAFFALGGFVTVGVGLQVRRPGRNVAGLQQALLAAVVLSLAGVAGSRVEPAVGGVVLVAVVGVLVALHPSREVVLRPRGEVSPPLLVLAAVATVPALWYAVDLLALARADGQSCFGGQCVHGDRLAETAALSVVVVLLVVAAALRPTGVRVPIWSAGIGAVVVGATALAIPGAEGAPIPAWAAAVVAWGLLVVLIGEREVRRGRAAREARAGRAPGEVRGRFSEGPR